MTTEDDKTQRPAIVAFVTHNRVGDRKYGSVMNISDSKQIYISHDMNAPVPWPSCNVSVPAPQREHVMNTFNNLEQSLAKNNLKFGDVNRAYIYISDDEAGMNTINCSAAFIGCEYVMYFLCGRPCAPDGREALIKQINPDAYIRSCECGGSNTLDTWLLREIMRD